MKDIKIKFFEANNLEGLELMVNAYIKNSEGFNFIVDSKYEVVAEHYYSAMFIFKKLDKK